MIDPLYKVYLGRQLGGTGGRTHHLQFHFFDPSRGRAWCQSGRVPEPFLSNFFENRSVANLCDIDPRDMCPECRGKILEQANK